MRIIEAIKKRTADNDRLYKILEELGEWREIRPTKQFKEKNKLILTYQIMNQKLKRTKCEIYTRVVGYLSPTSRWNNGKKSEFEDRKTFKV